MGLLLRGQAQKHRVLRGGAFNNNDRNVRCAIRNRNNPDNRNRNIGFRVVLSTFFNGPELPGGGFALPGRGEKWRSLLPAAPANGRAGRITTALHPGRLALVQGHYSNK